MKRTPAKTLFHITVFYRTVTSCNSYLVDVEADDIETAMLIGRKKFIKARPRHLRIDSIDAMQSRAS